eukprot:3871382-Pyramimonas_sp.AAC.1
MKAAEKCRGQSYHDLVATWWGRLSTVLFRLSKHRRRGNGRAQQFLLCDAARASAEDQPAGVHIPLAGTQGQEEEDTKGAAWSDWQARLMRVSTLSDDSVHKMANAAKRAAARACRRAAG